MVGTFAASRASATYRVETLQVPPDATAAVRKFDVPGAWLHAFLFDWEDGRAGEGEVILSVREVG